MNWLSKFLKKQKENYIRSWKERDNLERYGLLIFGIIMIGSIIFVPESKSKNLPQYLNILTILYLALMFSRVKKAKREVVDKNKEIETQKRLVEEKQKDILDSIHYAKRIQTSLLPTEKYIDKILSGPKTQLLTTENKEGTSYKQEKER
ncbi:MAG TPA: hypothetical protein VN026_18425 [Bacteroidia bacterium]|jgi:hypothetical protein|nr:hypothetical protein [Bacteroidia bacterium]